MSRLLKSWLNSYFEYTQESEAPEKYHLWAGLSTLASAVERKVWLPFGYSNIYPNMYVILVSPPGRCRKSSAIDISTDILSDLSGVTMESEDITTQALYRDLAGVQKTFQLNGKVIIHSSLSVHADELGSFFGVKDLAFLTLLIRLYDCKNKVEYKTKNAGVDYIPNSCLNILGGITPSSIIECLPPTAIGGGLTSRIIFVVEREKRGMKPIPVLTERQKQLKKQLTHDLEHIHTNLLGKFSISSIAKKEFEEWYIARGKNPNEIPDPRFQGYLERKPIHLLKLAMLSSISSGDSLQIELKDIIVARQLLADIEPKMAGVFGGLGESATAHNVDLVATMLADKRRLSLADILNANWMNTNEKELEIVLSTIVKAGWAKTIVDPTTNTIYWESTSKNPKKKG